jgi:cysteine desulfurase
MPHKILFKRARRPTYSNNMYNDNMKTIYLDYNASTPLDPEVVEEMIPYITVRHGNPSSSHAYGVALKEAIHLARQRVAFLLQCQASEIIFTSGASEANNWVIKGSSARHIITTQIEHPSILEACRFLEQKGTAVTYLPVDRYGSVDPGNVENAITPETGLISVMHANNEVGTIQPIAEISSIAKKHSILFHSDAAQSVGKIRVSVQELAVDLLTVAGHKLYAPKGIGALYLRSGVQLEPLIHGAGQESGLRGGTENAPYIVAMGKACEIAQRDLPMHEPRIRKLRDHFQSELKNKFGDKIVINGHPKLRLPNTLHVSFHGITGVDLVSRIPQIATSTGAACHSGQIHLSATLKAMGIDPQVGVGSVRLSLGRYTTREEIDAAVRLIAEAL